MRRIPTSLLKAPALGLPVQHPLVKQFLDESELPVTYLNFGATFMDNLFWMRDGLKRERKLIWHERLIPFIDSRDIAEVAGEQITHDGSREAFYEVYAHLGDRRAYLWDFFEYERANEVVWARNDFVERTLGRKPVTLREWLTAHAQQLLA